MLFLLVLLLIQCLVLASRTDTLWTATFASCVTSCPSNFHCTNTRHSVNLLLRTSTDSMCRHCTVMRYRLHWLFAMRTSERNSRRGCTKTHYQVNTRILSPFSVNKRTLPSHLMHTNNDPEQNRSQTNHKTKQTIDLLSFIHIHQTTNKHDNN